MKHDENEESLLRQPVPCPFGSSAAAYLLGALGTDEMRAFLAHLDQGCEACLAELGEDRETLAYLDATELWNEPSLVAPPASLYDTIRSRLPRRTEAEEQRAAAIQTWRNWGSGSDAPLRPGLTTLRAEESAWEPIGIDGIRVRMLAVDPERRMVTMLIRMDPGTSYPSHRHAATEECFVLEGELHVANEVLRAGDFQRAAAGSVHGPQWTKTGCTLLLVSSQDDELGA